MCVVFVCVCRQGHHDWILFQCDECVCFVCVCCVYVHTRTHTHTHTSLLERTHIHTRTLITISQCMRRFHSSLLLIYYLIFITPALAILDIVINTPNYSAVWIWGRRALGTCVMCGDLLIDHKFTTGFCSKIRYAYLTPTSYTHTFPQQELVIIFVSNRMERTGREE